MTDIDAERRIHQLEEQLRNARDDALEEAAKAVEGHRQWSRRGLWLRECHASAIRKLKGTPA